MSFETVIGLEVHTQLATATKIFSRTSTAYGAEPNTQASAIDLGMPGVLPVLNQQAVKMAIKFGLAVNAQVNLYSTFSRKHYFYPDLPKGYQISQYHPPIVGPGYLDIILDDQTEKRIHIERAHLEEDAGKSLHEDFYGQSGIDLNRAGTPLLEIVSAPDLRSAKEAVAYLKTLHSLVRYLGISDANMQEGSFRCDVNISVRPFGQEKFGTRVEVKNLNSFRFIERAIEFEVNRQITAIENHQTIRQETRLYDAVLNETRPLRSKEDANDYRFFPDPDLLPLILSEADLENARQELPELPSEKRARFQTEHHLSPYDAAVLVSSKELAAFFETVVSICHEPKISANWVMGDLLAFLNKHNLDITQSPIPAESIAVLIQRMQDNTISSKIAKMIFESLWNQEGTVDQIIDAKGLKQITDETSIRNTILEIIQQHPVQVNDFRSGKDKLFGFFVGQTMKATQGKANPDRVNELLKEMLSPPPSNG